MELINRIPITLDFRQSTKIPLPKINQYDSNIFEFTVLDDGVPADLSDVDNIVANFLKPDGNTVTKKLTAVDNVIEYRMGKQEMSAEGFGELNIQLFNGENRLSSMTMKVFVVKNLGLKFEGDHGIPLLQELFLEVATVMEDAQAGSNYALSQGDYAKEQADRAAVESADLSQLKSDAETATQSATSAAELANTNATEAGAQADYAKTQGDYAKGEYERLKDTDVGTLSAQLAERPTYEESRLKNVKLGQTDMTEEFLQQMAGNTPINSVPADGSVAPVKTTFFDIITGKNKYNSNDSNRKSNFQLQSDGTITSLSDWSVTGYIPISLNEKLEATYNSSGTRTASNGRWIGYNINKEPVLTTYVSSAGSYTSINSSVAYIRFSTLSSRFVDLQLEKGQKTSYEPYTEKSLLKNQVIPEFISFDSLEEADRVFALENRLGFKWKSFDVGKVIFMFDDGNIDISTVNSIFKNHSFPLSLAFLTSYAVNITTSGQNVIDVATDIQNNGGEIFSHSIDALPFTGLTEEEAEHKLRESKKYLRENGFNVNGFISPNGADMSDFIEISAKYYRYGYKLYGAEKPQYNLDRVNMSASPVSTIKTMIDSCATNKTMLILMAHKIDGTENAFTQTELEQILSYCDGRSDIDVTTVRDVYNQFAGV